MSTIRKELNPTGDISRNLEETLRKNGMEAHLREVGDSYQLLVMSHDSPQITYDISREDALKMMNGGNTVNGNTTTGKGGKTCSDGLSAQKN